MLRPTFYPTRDCETCASWESWIEYGNLMGDCSHEKQSKSTWRLNLEEWGVDPAAYCDDYNFSRDEDK